MQKKLQFIILSAILLLGINRVFSQSFEIDTKSQKLVEGTINDIDLKAFSYIINTSGADLDVKIEFVPIQMNSSARFQICIPGICYPPQLNTFTTGTFTIKPNDTEVNRVFDIALLNDFISDPVEGTSIFDVSVFNAKNVEEKITYSVTFIISKTGSVQVWKNTSSAFPNPAKDFININLNDNTSDNKIILYNELGTPVFSDTFNGSNYSVVTSNYSNGSYYFTILNNGKVINSGNFIIQK